MSSHRHSVPDLILEQYALGELPPKKMLEIERSMAGDPGIAARLDAIRISNEKILDAASPDDFAAGVRRRLHMRTVADEMRRKTRERGSRTWLVLAPVLSAVVVLIVFLVPGPDRSDIPGQMPPDSARTIRIKGLEPHLNVYRQTDQEPQLLTSDSLLTSGDMLQISYVAAGRRYGAIVSLDGRGTSTLHFPESASADAELVQEGETPVPFAYELDDAPFFERFFFVTAAESISVAAVMDAVSRLTIEAAGDEARSLSLPPEYEIYSILLRKRGAQK